MPCRKPMVRGRVSGQRWDLGVGSEELERVRWVGGGKQTGKPSGPEWSTRYPALEGEFQSAGDSEDVKGERGG